jgi:electron transfer flavoprotein-quinone oxidoreductase
LAAAFTMAKAGLEVVVVERGEYAGAKNVGGLLYGTVLNEQIPGFYERAPIERHVSRRGLTYLGDGEHASLSFGADAWSKAPFNHTFIVHRSQFDRWLASEVEKAGASLLEGMVADDLVYDGAGADKRAAGVALRGDDPMRSDAVVLSDGANALVTEKAIAALGIRQSRHTQEYAIGVKEIIGLPRGRIEDRFNLEENEGVALDFFGTPFAGLIGGGFIYTARESLHVGFVAKIATIVRAGLKPSDVMDAFKAHPFVRKLVQGGELLEYSAHRLPEGGYDAVPELTGNGALITGDAAGLVNASLYKEGTNHAMESGKAAAETLIDAKKRGDFSKKSLAGYEKTLRSGMALADLEKGRQIPHILESSPELTSLYPKKVTSLLVDLFSVAAEPKSKVQKKAVSRFLDGLPKYRFLRDALQARKLL